jgi:predicted Co/Zn/Cd cation transporter (cation efflux family)
MEDMTMNNSKKGKISTEKMVICVVTVIIAIVAAFGLIYGIVRANSMIIFQSSSLAAIDTVTICLNNMNIKREREAKNNISKN